MPIAIIAILSCVKKLVIDAIRPYIIVIIEPIIKKYNPFLVLQTIIYH
ncbi:unnamed protein product, partial [marine sediment metagenome]